MFRLRLDKAGTNTLPYPVDDDIVRIGSSTHVDVRLEDRSVSSEHCEIRRTGTQYRLVDLESKAGTRVNGAFVNQCVLEDGDVLDVGGVTMRFERDTATRTPERLPRVDLRPRAPMPRRRAAPTSALLAAGLVVVLLLIVVAVSSLRGADDDLTHNERIYREMRELKEQKLYVDALRASEAADPGSDRETYDKIQKFKVVVEALYLGKGPLSLQRHALQSKAALDVFIATHEGEYGAIRRRIAAFLDQFGEHSHISYVEEVRELARKYETLGGAGDPVLEKVSDAFAAMTREAKKDRRNHDYLVAIQRHETFLVEQGAGMPPDVLETYRLRVDRKVAEIRQEIDETWKQISAEAKAMILDGRHGEAAKLFRSVHDNEQGWPADLREEARQQLMALRKFGIR